MLAKILSEHSDSATLQGLDIRADQIAEAENHWGQKFDKEITTKFLNHRADRLQDLKEIENADVAFLRHQNYWNDREVWSRIFDQTLDRLDDDGLLVITSYFDLEHELATEALERLGAVQVGSIVNPNSRELTSAPGKSVDRHLAIFRKKAD